MCVEGGLSSVSEVMNVSRVHSQSRAKSVLRGVFCVVLGISLFFFWRAFRMAPDVAAEADVLAVVRSDLNAVSYTHLTLPTIYSV